MRVVVVGAGFAGLMAAWRLVQAGCDVVVLEARDRVGGRVWSQELVPGDPRTVIERGAEFVLDGYDVLRSVLAEAGLELAGTAMSYYEREPRGGEAVSAQDVAACGAAVAAAAAAAPPGTSLAAVAAGLGRAARRPGRLPVPHRDHPRRQRRPARRGRGRRRHGRVHPAPVLAGGRGQPGGGPGTRPAGSARRYGWAARPAPCSTITGASW